MNRVVVLALLLVGAAAFPMSATAVSPADVPATYSTNGDVLTIHALNLSPNPMYGVGVSLLGGAEVANPPNFSFNRPGEGVAMGPGFDFLSRDPILQNELVTLQARFFGNLTEVRLPLADGVDSIAVQSPNPPTAGGSTPSTPSTPTDDPFAPPDPFAPETPAPQTGDGESGACIPSPERRLASRSFFSNHRCPTSQPEPCKCEDLDLSFEKFQLIGGLPFEVKFFTKWHLICVGKGGKDCNGSFRIDEGDQGHLRAAGLTMRLRQPKKQPVECKRGSKCAERFGKQLVQFDINKHKQVPKEIKKLSIRDRLKRSAKRGDPLQFTLGFSKVCDGVQLKDTHSVTVVINEKVKVDKELSDLNGNRKPDGLEKS